MGVLANKSLTQKELMKDLSYDCDTGIFIRKISRSNVNIGDIAGGTEKNGYRVIRLKGKKYKAHRLAWLYIYGKFPDDQIDHINHIRNDNRISNLRSVTRSENLKNQSMFKNNTSGFSGVKWDKRDKVWKSQIGVNGKRIHLGEFTDKQDAIKARKEANIKYGFHENHGK